MKFADLDDSREDDGEWEQNEVVLEYYCWLVVLINFLHFCFVQFTWPCPTVNCC